MDIVQRENVVYESLLIPAPAGPRPVCFLNYANFPDFSNCQIYQFFVDVHLSELSWFNYLRQRLRTEYRKIVYHSQNSGIENAELTLLSWISEFPKWTDPPKCISMLILWVAWVPFNKYWYIKCLINHSKLGNYC